MSGGQFLSSLPVVGSLFDNSDQDAIDAIQQNQGLWSGLQVPNLQWQNYNPASVSPQLAQGTLVSDDPMVKSAQMAALAKMGDLSNTGLSDADQAGYQQARDIGNQTLNSGTQAAMQNAASRGILGSGNELAMREMASQQGAQNAQQSALQQSADSARQRALYLQAYGQGLGNMQAQQTNLSGQNAGILNQFNQANTGALNQAQYYNVGNQNQAQQYNNQGQLNTQQQNYQNQVAKLNGQTGANQQVANTYAAQNAANTANQNALLQTGAGVAMGMYGAGGTQQKQPNYNGQVNGGDSYSNFGSMA